MGGFVEGIQLSEVASGTAAEAARKALPFETGGILLGWRAGRLIIVDDIIHVPGEKRQRAEYTRDTKTTNRLLMARLADEGNPDVGYVGEWHSHPTPVGPSGLDLASLTKNAGRGTPPVGLIVLSFAPAANPPVFHGAAAYREGLPPARLQHPVPVVCHPNNEK